MKCPAPVATIALALSLSVSAGFAQILMQPTPMPTVTAENERWYLNGNPVAHAGNLYYPAGPQVFFNPSEMVRSGFYMGIPLYTRTTIEPYSMVYVPLAGGRMQPYERPRSGELTGTAGSTPTSIATPGETVPPAGLAPQAPGPPTQTTVVIPYQVTEPAAQPVVSVPPIVPPTIGTSGTTAPRVPRHTSIGGRPQGSNSIFIEFDSQRWYPTGPAEIIDTSRLALVGDYSGFAVYGDPADKEVVYVPVTRGSSLAVRYSRNRLPASLPASGFRLSASGGRKPA
jgi:hypothetical protein